MEDWPTFQKVQFQNFSFWIGNGLWKNSPKYIIGLPSLNHIILEKRSQNKSAYLKASLRAALSLNIECLTSSKSFVRLSQL